MKNFNLIIVFLLISFRSISQDAFFSNFDRSFSLANPSAIGMSDDINLTMIHRSQWMSIVRPFSTSQFEGFYPIKKANSNKKIATVGISFINERLGDGGSITNNQFALTGAYNFEFDNSNYLAAGLKAGYFNGATDLSSVSTGSQFINGYYDPSSPFGENVNNPVVNGIEITPSLTWFSKDSLGNNKYYIGVTGFNINQPISSSKDLSLVEDFRMPMRIALTGGGNIGFGEFAISPKALVMLQGSMAHVVLGSDFIYDLAKDSQKKTAIGIGGFYRLNDAAIMSLKYLSNKMDIGLTYDFTTSSIADPLNTSTGSFELFLNYKIKQVDKIKTFDFIIEVYDADTKELIEANAQFKNNATNENGNLFNNLSKSNISLNQKDEYQLFISKDNYDTDTISVMNNSDESKNQKVYLSKTIRLFDLELDILDKETNEPVNVTITLVDQNSGEQKEIGSGNKLLTELESGKKHTISLNAEGYENAVLELRYDKYGTLSKTMYVSKTKPEIIATQLQLIVLDETTKKPIKSTVMAINLTDPENQESSLIALNSLPPESYPLEIGNKFEILVTKEGYFNQKIKIEAKEAKDLKQVILLSPIEVGKSIIVEDLLFKTGNNALDERSFRILDQLVDFLNQNPTIRIELAGHTDSDGSDVFNQNLSEGRAQSAVNYLNNKGVNTSRLEAKGYGESKPLAPNTSPKGKAKNRRVELKIIGK
jgi:type IX secretion system PorP/SprF family membrane protein